MALTTCPECANSISDRAKACPHCGLPRESNAAPVTGIVEPATTPDGSHASWSYEGQLNGECPACSSQQGFETTTFTDEIATTAGSLAKLGWRTALFTDAFNFLRGAKIALTIRCTHCKKRFYLCRECMKPNHYESGRDQHCDHCGKPMVT